MPASSPPMILVLIEMPHKSELINFIFSARANSIPAVTSVSIVGVGSGTLTDGSSGTAGSPPSAGIVAIVVEVVVGVYLDEGGNNTSLTMIGGTGSTEFGKSNSSEKLGGQFLCDFGSSKWAKNGLFFL